MPDDEESLVGPNGMPLPPPPPGLNLPPPPPIPVPPPPPVEANENPQSGKDSEDIEILLKKGQRMIFKATGRRGNPTGTPQQ